MKGFLGWKFSCLLWHSGYMIASMSYMVYPEVKAKTLISKQGGSHNHSSKPLMRWNGLTTTIIPRNRHPHELLDSVTGERPPVIGDN
jgi:hypothetical protein